MKNIIIIDTFISNERQNNLLLDCIDSVKKTGYDIMVVSHSVISEEIQKKVNYFLYDNDNTFLPSEITPFFWVNILNNQFRIFNPGHALPICRNITNSLMFAKSLGYEFFYFMEYDIIFNDSDLQILTELRDNMYLDNKSMVLFEPSDFYECGSHVYETLLFGGNVEYFLSKFKPPINLDEWLDFKMGHTLELSFYEKLSKNSNDFLIIPEHSSNFFKNSEVNVYRYGLVVFDLIYNHNQPDRPLLLLYKSTDDNQEYVIKVFLNEILIHEMNLCQGCWWFRDFIIDGSSIRIESFLNGEKHKIKEYTLNKNINSIITMNGDVKLIN